MARHADRAAWLTDPGQACGPSAVPDRPYRLVLLGAPGVGKGTQAALLSERLGPCHLSTGDIFRSARTQPACNRTPALNAAIAAMERGELVPDELVLQIVAERVACLRCHGGFLLDGFPRTLVQAEALDDLLTREHLRLDAVLSYELPIDRIVARLSGRRVCPACKAVYHVEAQPPRVAGRCDLCGGALVQREDDRPEAVRVRMDTYATATAPLVEYYRQRGLLRVVPADGTPEDIYARTVAMLNTELVSG